MKKITRKQFLGSLILGGTSLVIWKSLPLGDIKGYYLTLSRWNLDTLKKMADAVLPRGDGFPSAEQAQLFRRLDEELYFCTGSISSEMRDALLLAEWYPFFCGYFSRFSRLSTEDAARVIDTGMKSENDLVRVVFSNLRMVIFMIYYGHESTYAKIGYDGPFGGFGEILSEQRKYYAEQTR
ncbi:hypothetical protein [Leptonema illini]|uniref:Gluconate 2-dehydrogenase subunit 3 family protein n=1 Tax=Leptonema illini DSM 21528 TaxID=929563 RepID=H2CAZ6_9LEPT|nr:hypothetical protein [Leptonema illini]EHQ08591.1 hypothetical protein Lepil_3941 [Leptonema illini DSM 21528]